MKIKVSRIGQVIFFPKSEQDVFALGRLAGRLGKAGSFPYWEQVQYKSDRSDPLGTYKSVLQSLTVPSKVLMDCIKTHILKEA